MKAASTAPASTREPRWLLAAGSVCVMALGLIALTRSLHLEGSPILVMVAAASPVLLMAAVPMAGYALATRRWVLLAVMLVIAGANLAGIVGERGGGPHPSTGGPELVLATVNIEVGNEQVGVLLAGLAESADIVFLQEVTAAEVDLLEASSAWDAFPARVLDPRPGFHGSAILSKFPLDDGGVVWVDGWPMTAAVVTVPGVDPSTPLRVSLVNVHVQAPLSETGRWAAQMRELGRFAQQHDDAVIYAGDFNSTSSHRPLQELLGTLVHDAHLQAGSGFGATWPAGGLAPSVLRLDRVLVSAHFAALETETFEALGSNHRGVMSRLEVVDPPELSEN